MSTLDLGKIKYLWRGTWSAASTYAINDVVANNSAIWICTQAHAVGTGSEFAPGKRDRASAYGRTLDNDEVITYNITVQTFNSANYFYVDGVRTPALTLFPNVRYRFLQQDPSNLNHRFAFSNTADGIFNGGTELTAGIVYRGTPGIDGSVEVILPSSTAATIYYYSAQDINYGAGTTGRITRGSTWRGWQYWDQVTSGFNFRNTWNASTQYYYNDIIEYQGATYIALADSFNKQPSSPGNNHFWLVMVNGDRRSEHNSVAHFMNKGPIDWPYGNGNSGYPNAHGSLKWISRSGRVYHHGPGSSQSHGLDFSSGSVNISHAQEICFNHFEWWNSRDNGGPGRMVTPDGQPPRCIQIEQGFQYAYALFNNGELWAWGENAAGGAGTGDFSNVGIPRRVIGLQETRIVKISCGWGDRSNNRHVLALDEYGYVWTWGRNNVGQLGVGHTQDMNQAQRLPRSYFGGERIIDVLAMAGESGHSYARTSSDNLYAWGNNAVYQLGDTSLTNRYRPVKMLNWDPTANNGIRKWQAANTGSAAAFMILDGNGFLWGTGDDQFGNLANTTNTNKTQLTKSTATPGGSIADFWMLWSDANFANKLTFIRHTNGSTYVCGLGANGSYVNGLNASTSAVYPPSLIPTAANITNLRDVSLNSAYTASQLRTIHFLLDNGRVLSQGYNGYALIGNPEKGTTSNPTDETASTSFPVTTYIPPSTRIRQLIPGGSTLTDYNYVHGTFYMTDTGQIFAVGLNRNPSAARDSNFGCFTSWSPSFGEGSAGPAGLITIAYAR
jgi:hypothetical protein